MKRFRNKKVLTVAAVLLVLVTAVGLAGAFFSDYEHAIGQATFQLGGNTTIEEEVKGLEKTITIHNNGEGDAFVRVSIFGPEADEANGIKGMTVSAGDGWSEGEGGFWYYQNVLPKDGDTTAIIASIADVPVTVDLSELDIIVVHESVPVVYDTEGNADMAASWKAAANQ